MKLLTLEQLRRDIAKSQAESFDIFTEDLEEIFLFGIAGVYTYTPEEVVDAWINSTSESNNLIELGVTEQGSLVGQVVGDDGKTVLFNLYEENEGVAFEVGLGEDKVITDQ